MRARSAVLGVAGDVARRRACGVAGRALLERALLASAMAAFVAAPIAVPISAQDFTHPRDMGLAEPGFERPDPERMRVDFDNGLAAYVARDDRAPLVTLTAFVAAGTAHGGAGEASVVGRALRRGPASMTGTAFRDALDDMAAHYTVTVGREETEVTLDVPAEDAWPAIDLLVDVLREPSWSTSAVVAAGRTSQAEGIDWASSIAGAIALFENRLYESHPFGRSPAAAEMEAAREGGAERFHRAYFVPSNIVLAVAGDFDLGNALLRLSGAVEGWQGRERPERVTFPAVETSAPRRVLLAEAEKLQGWAVIGHEIPVIPREDEAALDVMDYILGAYHLDSRLFRESRELRGLTNDNSSFLEPGVLGPGTYTMRTYGRPEAVRLLVDVTFRELERIRETRASDDELFVAKGALVDGLYAARYATGLDAARSYALEWLRDGSHEWSAGYPDRIRAVTLAQVQEAARRYLHPERMLVSIVGPLGEIEAAPMIESEPQLGAWGRVERVDGGGR